MKIFGIDPGSERTGYGCVETDGSRHRLVDLRSDHEPPPPRRFPTSCWRFIHGLAALLAECRPDCVAIENLFHAVNVRSALKLGHARGVAMLAAVEAGVPVVEYTPAEIKRAVVGYGRAEKHQVQQMVKLDCCGAAVVPAPTTRRTRWPLPSVTCIRPRRLMAGGASAGIARGRPTSWRHYRPNWTLVIAHLRGRIFEKQPNRVVVDVNGVGYDVSVPLSTLLRSGRGRRRDRAAHSHARARGCAVALRFRDACSSRTCSSG